MPTYLRILLALAGLQAVSFTAVAMLTAIPIPIIDNVGITSRVIADGFSWSWLLGAWNQHVIAVPRLLLMADIAITGGHMAIFTVLALLSWGGVFLIVSRFAMQATSDRLLFLLSCAVLGLAMFRGFLLESIIINNGFNYPLTALFAVAAFAVAARLQPGRPVLATSTLSALAALASGLCLANGILAVPIAALIALLRGRAFLALLPFLIAAGVIAAVYTPVIAVASTVQFDVATLFQSATNMFGAPWVRKIGVLGQGVGFCIALLALIAAGTILRRLRKLDAVDVFAGALLMFSMGTVILIGIGRPDLSENTGLIGRYAIWVAMAHMGIVLVAMRSPVIMGWASRRWFQAVVLIVALLLVVEQGRFIWVYAHLGHDMQTAAQALQSGARSDALFGRILTAPAIAAPAYDLYAARGLYGFH